MKFIIEFELPDEGNNYELAESAAVDLFQSLHDKDVKGKFIQVHMVEKRITAFEF